MNPKVLEKLRPERFLSLLIGLMGVINLVSAVIPAIKERMLVLDKLFPLDVRTGTRLATAFAGFALLLLAFGIWRGKRNAWYITLGTLLLTFFGHLIKGFDFEEASLAFLLILFLVLLRSRFQARSDRPTILRGLRAVGIAVAFTLAYGTLGFYLLDHHFTMTFNLWEAISQTVRMFTEFTNPGSITTTRYGQYFTDSIYLIGAVTMGYALLALLTPVLIHFPSTLTEQEQAAAIIRKYGRTVLARFCLFEDKHFFFSPGGSLIAYALSNRTAAVLGDPIGPSEDALNAIQSFQKVCAKNDWLLAFYQTREDLLETYQAAGLKALKIGEEAIVDLSRFTLQGGEMKSIRTVVNKLDRLGYKYLVSQPPHTDDLLSQLEDISNEWMLERKGKEMKYSMGSFSRAYLVTTPILYLVNPDGLPIAFVNLVDEYQNKELAVDLMRHRTGTPAGTMDYLFVSMLKQAREWQYERFNLGLSGLAGVGETSSDPAIERVLHFIYSKVNTAYNFRGLHQFKQKFNPDWQPRYLIYPNLASLPAVALALNDLSD